MTDFDRALQFLLRWEGGYSNHEADKGGRTDKGIAEHANPDAWADDKVTMDEAKEIYRTRYWEAAGCDDLEWPMNLIVFDSAVNCGTGRAKQWLKDHPEPDEYIANRILYYTSLKDLWPHFGRGWVNRMADLIGTADLVSSEQETPALIQVFEDDRRYDFQPVKTTYGETNDGETKIMVRIAPRTFFQRLKSAIWGD